MSYYRQTGESEEILLRREDREDARLELERQSLELEKQKIAAQRSSAFWEALQAFALGAIPIATFFGLKGWLGLDKEKAK